ncbi:phage tail protein [Methylocystis sp. S23]
MTLETFTPPIQPSIGASNKPKVKILKAEFGDGYGQASRDGLNHIRNEFSLTWEVLTPAQANTIEAFLIEHGGDVPFLWTAPGKSTPDKWTCEQWEVSFLAAIYQGENFRSIKATFTQSFNIVT